MSQQPRSSSALVFSRASIGLETHLVSVECQIASGLPGTTIVGMAEGAVKESRDRVKSAIRHSGFKYPTSHIVINLAPSHLGKQGSGFDLPIAISILAASGQIPANALEQTEFIGELGLFGEIRKAQGALNIALACKASNHRLFIPWRNADDVTLVSDADIWTATTLIDLAAFLCGNGANNVLKSTVSCNETMARHSSIPSSNYAHIVGQEEAKRGLLLAASGGHHMLMIGPPGAGKTLLARSLAEILPNLSQEQMLEVAAIYGAGAITRKNLFSPPFRDPHHSASAIAIIGGGRTPIPGELTLAHHGVLFLDELPHFKPSTLDLLREPIETGQAVIARTGYRVRFPCKFQLVAAMNPCPAGLRCDEGNCRCSQGQVQRYQSRVSGPLLDRIDIHFQVPPLDSAEMISATQGQASASDGLRTLHQIRAKVDQARALQNTRQGCLNSHLSGLQLNAVIQQSEVPQELLELASRNLDMSMRSFYKTWRIARTIADLAESTRVEKEHFLEALGYRSMNWSNLTGH